MTRVVPVLALAALALLPLDASASELDLRIGAFFPRAESNVFDDVSDLYGFGEDDPVEKRDWVGVYGGVMAYRKNNAADSALARLSPDYTDDEITHLWDGNAFAAPFLLPEVVSLDMSSIKQLDCPLILFLGRKDINVNSEVAAEWFAKVKAPQKQLVWFEHSAHMPMTEEPGKFLVSLVSYARPIAERAGDVAR